MPVLAGALQLTGVSGDGTWIIDGTLIPVHDQSITAISKNYRRSVNTQILINADTRRVAAVGQCWPGNRKSRGSASERAQWRCAASLNRLWAVWRERPSALPISLQDAPREWAYLTAKVGSATVSKMRTTRTVQRFSNGARRS